MRFGQPLACLDAQQPARPMGFFDAIAGAFDEPAAEESTTGDIDVFRRHLQGAATGFFHFPDSKAMPQLPQLPNMPHMPHMPHLPHLPHLPALPHLSLPHLHHSGAVFVHPRKAQEPLPAVVPPPLSGVSSIDAEYRRRAEQAMQEMSQDFSKFSLAGLAWMEQRTQDAEAVAAERSAEDAEIARKRFEEDAALAARRALADEQRGQTEQMNLSSFCSNREAEELALGQRWRSKFAELSAALDERVSAHQAEIALREQRARERAKADAEAVARQAAAEAEIAKGAFERREAARREAERQKLRLSAAPSLRSFILVAPEHIISSMRFAVDAREATATLRQDDRSWWKLLHFLEAEGLTPPLKVSPTNPAAWQVPCATRHRSIA